MKSLLRFAIVPALLFPAAASAGQFGLPDDPKDLALACSAILMAGSNRDQMAGNPADPAIDAAANRWLDEAARLTGKDVNTLLGDPDLQSRTANATDEAFFPAQEITCRDKAPK